MQDRLAGSLIILIAALCFSPSLIAQNNQPSGTSKPPAAASATTSSSTHDLSGVWMQYAEGTEPGFARMNGVDDRVRPPLTSWGQAKFDAAKPLMGPRAVGGSEDRAALHCE